MNDIHVEVVDAINEFTSILVSLGCDVTKIPKNQFELGVLWIQYSWAAFLVGIGFKSITKLIFGFASGMGTRSW